MLGRQLYEKTQTRTNKEHRLHSRWQSTSGGHNRRRSLPSRWAMKAAGAPACSGLAIVLCFLVRTPSTACAELCMYV